MILKIMLYAMAMAAALGVVGLCLERLAALWGLPRRAAWVVALLFSILWPAFNILRAEPLPASSVSQAAAQTQEHGTGHLAASSGATSASTAAAADAQPATRTAGGWNVQRLASDRNLLAAWGIASLFSSLHLIAAHLRLRRRIAGWRHGTLHGHPLLLSETTGPALVGVLRPRIVVPHWLLDEPHSAQRLVLEHERQHIAARDPLLIRAGAVLLAIIPWNLPLWWQCRRLRQAIELDCDARVLRTGATAESYGEALLATVEHRTLMPSGVVAMSEPVSALERRIQNLLPEADRHAGIKTRLALLLMVAGVTAACSMSAPPIPGAVAPGAAAAQSQPATPTPPVLAALDAVKPGPAEPGTAPKPTLPTLPAAQPMSGTSAPAREQQPPATPAIETGYLQVKYATAKNLAALIQSGSGVGLLSAWGTLSTDDRTNTIVVRDSRQNIAAIRALVAQLDVPVEQVLVKGVFAMIDEDLIEELLGVAPADRRSLPVVDYGADETVFAALEAGQRAGRAEIVARPQVIAANHLQTTIEQDVDLAPPADPAPSLATRRMNLRLSITPTVRPDQRILVDIKAQLDSIGSVVVVTNGVRVPTIDTRETSTQIVTDYGATMLLDFTKREASGAAANPGQKRRLVALLTLKKLENSVAASR